MSADANLGREDWERATLRTIAEGGLGAVHIDDVAQRLGVTKGSFYWHFSSRDELLEATLTRWRDDTLTALAASADRASPRACLVALAESSLREHDVARVEVALAGDVDDERVTPFVEAVVQRRLALLERIFTELGATDVKSLAVLAHALYLGYLHTVRVDPARRIVPTRVIVRRWLALFSA